MKKLQVFVPKSDSDRCFFGLIDPAGNSASPDGIGNYGERHLIAEPPVEKQTGRNCGLFAVIPNAG